MTTIDPPQKRKRKKWRSLVILLSLFAVDQIWVQWDRRITIGHDTTRIIAPIVGGYPDYLAAMNESHSQGIMAENNAAPPIIAIVGLPPEPAAWRHAVYAKWGIPEPAGKPLFRDYTSWMKDQAQFPPTTTEDCNSCESPFDSEEEKAAEGPWSAADHRQLAQWLKEMTPALAALEDACRRSKFYFPLVLEDGRVSAPGEPALLTLTPQLGSLRTLARALVLRAMLRLHDGDITGFQNDILLCMGFARLLVQQPTYIDHMVAIAIDSYALEAVQHAAAEPLDASAAERLRNKIEFMNPMPTPTHAIDEAERYSALGATFTFRKATDKYWGFSFFPINYDASLQRVNAMFDRCVRAFNLPTAPQRRDAMIQLKKDVDDQFENAGTLYRLSHMEGFFLAILFPSLSKSDDLQTALLVDRDLALTALALRQAKARDGIFPATLAKLNIPGFTPPPDRFIEKPLVYKRQGGGYLLYSVGRDLEDNGGQPRSEKAPSDKWDIVQTVSK